MTDEQLGQIYHTARNAETFRDFKAVALDILSERIADTAKPVIDKSMVKRLMVQHGLDKLPESIADTAGAKPVAYEVHWPNGEHELIYASALRMISDLGDFTLTELYAAPSAPSVADAAGAKEDARDAARYRWLQKQRAAAWHGLGEMPMNRCDEFIDAEIAKESGK